MEEEKLGNFNGLLNTEAVIEGNNYGMLKTSTVGFSAAEMSSLTALCNAFFPSLPLEASGLLLDGSDFSKDVEEFYRASLPDGWSTFEVAETMRNLFNAEVLKILKKVLWLLSTYLGTFLLAGRQSLSTEFPFVQRFGDLTVEKRERVLLDWSTSSLSFFRVIFKVFKGTLMWNHFTRVNEKGYNPFWKAINYCGPDPVAMTAQLSPKPLESSVLDISALNGDELESALESHGCKLTSPSEIAALADVQCSPKDHAIECDVVIVGSGSGGGVAAAVLAKAGFKVVVLEKGGYKARHDLDLLEAESMRDLYEEKGLLRTEDQNMVIFAGSTVGGGSAINWSASFRTPDHVLREWTQTLGLEMFQSPRYREAMDRVCDRLGVQEDCEEESFQNAVLRKGCEALGYHVGNVPRNATADHYCGWCNLGCRRGTKQATSETWLVDAINAGAVILTRCSAHRVLHTSNSGRKGRKAIGVVAKIGGTERQLFIRARATVVSSGALRTPPLLHASGLENPHIGKNLHLHPVQIVWGYFPPGVAAQGTCYQGGIMTAFSNETAAWDTTGYGAILQTPILHPGAFAGAIPWRSGSHFKQTMLKFSRTCSFIVLLRDRGSGTVAPKADGSLDIKYKLQPDDEERAREGVEKGLRVLAAAGAVEVGSHHQDLESFKLGPDSSRIHDKDFEEYVSRVGKKGGAPLYCAHQMGSCRMGVSSGESAVDENGESWEVEGVYVADGSVLPTALGINPMITIQSIAYCIAHNVVQYINETRP
ncbi:hypothetical protein SUGI_0496530 [Cryptomeria japonica]|uniref:long-chain-alcohol oxidase FAO4A n=1 Tax=Cryptomeria japonica TaxID=3369 RepID=UPI002408A538|nr:long-chain-alcohol oxidase FAO4A [Cryptomeria japonica]GLJ25900.1 hypothetical protein SUGI_0496530 [Cryptomeria japonica]